jgi:integrase
MWWPFCVTVEVCTILQSCPDLHFHGLRHEAISRFFEMSLTAPEVASISGHRDIRMLMRYAHPMRQRIIEQMDKGDTERGRK